MAGEILYHFLFSTVFIKRVFQLFCHELGRKIDTTLVSVWRWTCHQQSVILAQEWKQRETASLTVSILCAKLSYPTVGCCFIFSRQTKEGDQSSLLTLGKILNKCTPKMLNNSFNFQKRLRCYSLKQLDTVYFSRCYSNSSKHSLLGIIFHDGLIHNWFSTKYLRQPEWCTWDWL